MIVTDTTGNITIKGATFDNVTIDEACGTVTFVDCVFKCDRPSFSPDVTFEKVSGYYDGSSGDVEKVESSIEEVNQGAIDGGWQPIETAPNGCYDTFMVFKPSWGMEVVEVARGGELMYGGLEVIDAPTHWMPLPEPPK